MERHVEITAGITEIDPGMIVNVEAINPYAGIEPSHTDYHEAAHAVAGENDVQEVSNVAGPGYLGRTLLTRFNAIAFAAAHALGYGGTGHDLAVLRMMGYDPESVASDARRELAGREGEIHAVASELALNRTISGFRVKAAIERYRNPMVKVEIKNPLGEITSFVASARKTIFGHSVSLGLPPKPAPMPA